MALPNLETIKYIHEKNIKDVSFYLRDICIYENVQFKKADMWIKEGLLPLDKIKTKGSGHDRIFFYEACYMFMVLAKLEDLGMGNLKIRELTKIIFPLLDEPYGYIALNLKNLARSFHIHTGAGDMAQVVKAHFKTGECSPLFILDLDRIHIELADLHFDYMAKDEMVLAAQISEQRSRLDRPSRLVEVLEQQKEDKI